MHKPQPLGVCLGRFEQVAFGADVAFQRHDHVLADGVDGRVGYLGEQLLEIVVEHAWLVGHHRQGAVVAHRAERIAQFGHQRQEHELHGLGGVAERLHPRQKRRFVEPGRFRPGQIAEIHALACKPFAIGTAAGPLGLDLLVRNHAPGFEIDEEDLAWLQAALGDYLGGVDVNDADLGSHDASVVVGDVVARRA